MLPERMVFGTGIANVWARSPQTAHGAAAFLAQAFPDRFVLGLGVGYPAQAASAGRESGSPVATMRGYLDQMSAPTQLPVPDVAYRRSSARAARECCRWPARRPTAVADTDLDRAKTAAIAAKAGEHLAAGADHVMLLPAADVTDGVDAHSPLA